MESIFDCCVHTLESPTLVSSACEGRFLAGEEAVHSAVAKPSGIVLLESESKGAAFVDLTSYDRVDHVYTVSVQGEHQE
jgi:hypothetical protein